MIYENRIKTEEINIFENNEKLEEPKCKKEAKTANKVKKLVEKDVHLFF